MKRKPKSKASKGDTVRLREDFAAAMKAISKHLGFAFDGMMIVMSSSPDKIIAEGKALHAAAAQARP